MPLGNSAFDTLPLSMRRWPSTHMVVPLRPSKGRSHSMAYAINLEGQAVGMSYNPPIDEVPVLWDRGIVYPLPMPRGCLAAAAWDINPSGMMVGTGRTSRGDIALFWPNRRRVVTLPDLIAGGHSCAWALNDSGEIVGASTYDLSWRMHPCLWTNGTTPADLGTLGGDTGFAHDISNKHRIVGWSRRKRSLHDTAFSRTSKATMTPLRGLGGAQWGAESCNDAGQIVGWASTPAGLDHAVLWQGTSVTDLGTLGGPSSRAFAINADGIIVGYSDQPAAAGVAFVYRSGRMQDLNNFVYGSHWVLSIAWDINDAGWIVGQGKDPGGNTIGFLFR